MWAGPLLVIACFTPIGRAEEAPDISVFEVAMEMSAAGLQATGVRGCDFETKSESRNLRMQALGKTMEKTFAYTVESTHASDFAFTAQWTDGKVSLGAIRGCAWEEASYDCGEQIPCRFTVDASGVRPTQAVE